MRINSNIMAINSHGRLTHNQVNKSRSLEKLSSGYRINKAGDDAAGLAISEKMRAQIRGFHQAERNAQDGVSLIQTAEGALSETHAILQRMRELAVQSANDTNTNEDREEIQREVDQLVEEITRISSHTEFNTMKLLDKSFMGKVFHIGANENQNMSLDIGDMSAVGLKLFSERTIEMSGTLEEDVEIFLGVGTHVLKDENDTIVAVFVHYMAPDESNDEFEGFPGGYFYRPEDIEKHPTEEGWLVAKNGATALAIDHKWQIVDFHTGESLTPDVDHIEFRKEVEINGESYTGYFEAGKESSFDTLVAVWLFYVVPDGVGEETTGIFLKENVEMLATGQGLKHKEGVLPDMNYSYQHEDGSLYEKALFAPYDFSFSSDQDITELNPLCVSTQITANEAIDIIDNATGLVSSERSKLGAIQNRLEHTISNLSLSHENLQAAESRIRDLDMAKEAMEYAKNSILEQVSTAMLTQANAAPQAVLQLLG